MNTTTRLLCTLGLLGSFGGLTGCLGAGAELNTAEAEDSVTAEELRAPAFERLRGAWRGQSGPFQGLVLNDTPTGIGRHFFADIDTGIRCITTPCPSGGRIEGRYTSGPLTLTLSPAGRPARELAAYYGRYYYTLQGDTLTLSKSGRVVARLVRATSYCGDADDCAEQGLIRPACLGAHTCVENRCGYRCTPTGPVTCETLRCGVGYFCVAGETPTDDARCLTDCARMRCAAGHTCTNTPEGARCIADGPSCALIRCASGTTCVEENGVGRCVADAPAPVRCGSATCAAGYVCCNPLRSICTPPGWSCIQ